MTRQKRLAVFLSKPMFHHTIIGLVITDMVLVIIGLVIELLHTPCTTEEQLQWFAQHHYTVLPPTPKCKIPDSYALMVGDWLLWATSVFLLFIFVMDLSASGTAFGFKAHFKQPLYAIDAVVVIASIVIEVIFRFADGGKLEMTPTVIILLRLWKIVRAIHAIAHSIELKNEQLIKAVKDAKRELEDRLRKANNTILHYAPHLKEIDLEEHIELVSAAKEKMDSWSSSEDSQSRCVMASGRFSFI
jgi:hypothetical protein